MKQMWEVVVGSEEFRVTLQNCPREGETLFFLVQEEKFSVAKSLRVVEVIHYGECDGDSGAGDVVGRVRCRF